MTVRTVNTKIVRKRKLTSEIVSYGDGDISGYSYLKITPPQGCRVVIQKITSNNSSNRLKINIGRSTNPTRSTYMRDYFIGDYPNEMNMTVKGWVDSDMYIHPRELSPNEYGAGSVYYAIERVAEIEEEEV